MDVSKLRFDIEITYSCDEGEGDAILDNGTYEQAVKLVQDLDSRTYITGYYHCMSIFTFDVYDENGELLDLCTILDGDYEWVPEYYSIDKDDATEVPGYLLELLEELVLLEELKNGDEGKRAREVEELKTRIDKLKKELKEAEEKLSKLEEKK